MKMRHDMVTGIVGLLTCIFFFIMTQQVRQPANLLEPGPRGSGCCRMWLSS